MEQTAKKVQKKRRVYYLTTGVVTLSFPHLFTPVDKFEKKPKDKKKDEELVYKTRMIISKDDKVMVEKIKDILNLIAKEHNSTTFQNDIEGLYNPFRNGDKEYPGDEWYKNSYFCDARTPFPPRVTKGRNLETVTDPRDVYGGCKATVGLSLVPYYVSPTSKGITLGFTDVCILSGGRGGRPTPQDLFGDVLAEYYKDDENNTEEPF